MRKYIRAVRLPFLIASALPFVFGSLIERSNFNLGLFLLGLGAVIWTHAGANLINDYADSRSGADWQDRKWYNFFGGSKLIQDGGLSENFYLYLSTVFFVAAGVSVFWLALALKSILIPRAYFLIAFLGFFYSCKPLCLSYRRLGEPVIFLLFGPALVMGGYYLQTQIFPDVKSLILSLPFAFFTTAILFSNELPDYAEDIKVGKFTWVSLTGPKKAFVLYSALIFLGISSVIAAVIYGHLKISSLFCLTLVFPALKAAGILKTRYQDKMSLIESSKLTIAMQALLSLILILSIII